MALLDNGMSMMDVPTFWQYIVKGGKLPATILGSGNMPILDMRSK